MNVKYTQESKKGKHKHISLAMKTNDSCGYYNALPHTGQIYAHCK